MEKVDVKREAATEQLALEQPQLMTHQLHTVDPQEALAVLQTLLAGLPDVRMSLDLKTNKVIALARPSEHRTIQETIRQLEGESPQFKVFQVTKDGREDDGGRHRKFFPRRKAIRTRLPWMPIPSTLKLFVHATPRDLERVGALIEQLEGRSGEGGSTSTLRSFRWPAKRRSRP